MGASRIMKEKKQMLRLLLGSALYQAVWFAAVLSAGEAARWWWGVLAAAGFLTITLAGWKALRARVLALTGAALVLGLVVDTIMIASRIWSTPRMFMPYPLPPVWLLMVWVGFGTYIAMSLDMLYGRYRMAALVGAVGGMLAYRGGAALDAIQWGEPAWLCTLILMLAWAIVFPALVWLATWMQRQESAVRLHESRMHVALM
jgi:hypothetical protein